MITHPGKKLNFMGNELAMFREWDEKRELDWPLLEVAEHRLFHHYIKMLNHLYLKMQPAWQMDHTYDGFKWVDCKSDNKCVFGYTRTNGTDTIMVLFNFSNREATIAPEMRGTTKILLNTEWNAFGGAIPQSDIGTLPKIMPPFSGIVCNYQE